MATNEVIGLSAEMKVQQALDELKRLGPGADKEAKAIAASLGKALKDSEKAAKKLGEEMAKAGKNAGGGFDKALKALGPLGGVLGRISPEASAAASSIAGLTSASEGFAGAGLGLTAESAAVAMGALGAVVGVAALGWLSYTEAASEAARVQGEVAAATRALTPLLDAARIAEVDAAVAIGEMTEAAGKLQRDGIAAMQAFGAATKDTQAKIKGLHDRAGSLSEVVGDFADSLQTDPLYEYSIPLRGLGFLLDGVSTSSTETQVEIDALSGTLVVAADAVGRTTTAHRTAAAATAHHAATSRDLSSAIKAEAEADKLRRDAFIAAAEAYNDADAIVAKSGEFRLSEVEKITRAEEDAVAAYLDLAHAAQSSDEQIAADTATIRGNYEDQITAKMADEQAKREADARASAERMAAAQAAATARTVGMITDSAQVAASVLSSLGESADATYSHALDMADRLTGQLAAGEEYYTEAQKSALQRRIAAQRDAAHKAFQAQKAAGVATATVQLFVAEAQAVASAPFPYNLPAIAEAGIAGGAAVAGAASVQEPTFHRGYKPDEIPATILRKEAVMTPTAANAMGPKQIDRLNDGQTRGGYSGPAPVILGHRVVNDMIKRELQNSGALTAALSAGTILGHRTNRRGVTG